VTFNAISAAPISGFLVLTSNSPTSPQSTPLSGTPLDKKLPYTAVWGSWYTKQTTQQSKEAGEALLQPKEVLPPARVAVSPTLANAPIATPVAEPTLAPQDAGLPVKQEEPTKANVVGELVSTAGSVVTPKASSADPAPVASEARKDGKSLAPTKKSKSKARPTKAS
jgi:hypothetical protein